jgi:hypothetical protein
MELNQPPVMALADVDADLLDRAQAAAADHPELLDALSKLQRVGELDIEHQPAEFEAIHLLLRSALDGAD